MWNRSVAGVCLLLVGLAPAAWAQQVAKTEAPPSIEAIIGEVQYALSEAQPALAGMGMKLETVVLTLTTEVQSDQNHNFRLFVFLFGGSQSKVSSGELTLTLGPPPPPVKTETARKSETLSAGFVAAIRQAAQGVEKANPKQLRLQKLRTQLKFVVKGSGAGGVKYEIVPVSIDMSRTEAQTAAHTVELTFVSTASKPQPPGSVRSR